MDISVLEQGEAANRGSGGDGVDSPSNTDLIPLLIWLDEVQRDDAREFMMDPAYRLWAEYEKVGGDSYVLRILDEKQRKGLLRIAPRIAYHERDGVTVPTALAERALPWKLVLAVTLTDREKISIVNATDPDWLRHEEDLAAESVSVEHLLDAWLRGFVARHDAPGPQPGDLQYHQAPAQLGGELAGATNVGKGTNGRTAWEDGRRRYEFDSQHNTVEVYQLSNGTWLHEATLDGTVTKTAGGEGRRWGKP
jgi:hypothetical protein